MKKLSFFERLSGSMPIEDDFDTFEYTNERRQTAPATVPFNQNTHTQHEEEESTGQLPVDVYETQSEIIIRTFIAGVRPDEMNISISRDSITIDGMREERTQVSDQDYTLRELFWGSFSRTITLSQEIDVDSSSATAKDGLLTLILPKMDRSRQTKLKVKVG
jgi:HSP20 family protein